MRCRWISSYQRGWGGAGGWITLTGLTQQDCCVFAKQRPRDSRGRDRMVVGFTTTCAISAYHH